MPSAPRPLPSAATRTRVARAAGDLGAAAAQQMDNDWFARLRAALGSQVETLTIVAPTIYGQLTWTLNSKDRWKFWRKPRPLVTLAKALAEGTPS